MYIENCNVTIFSILWVDTRKSSLKSFQVLDSLVFQIMDLHTMQQNEVLNQSSMFCHTVRPFGHFGASHEELLKKKRKFTLISVNDALNL